MSIHVFTQEVSYFVIKCFEAATVLGYLPSIYQKLFSGFVVEVVEFKTREIQACSI
jgi:hypothetical protein